MRALGLVAMVLALGACGGAEQGQPVAEAQAAPASAVVASAPVAASEAVVASESKQYDSKMIVNIHNVAFQPKEVIDGMLGQPVAECEKGKYGLKCQYDKDDVKYEIVFIKGKADWITLESPRFGRPLDVPEQLYMQHERSTSMTAQQIIWEGRYGFNSMMVAVAPGDKVDFVYIKATTK